METKIEFYKADEASLPLLRSIAYQSEAHWGYDASFMRIFEQKFNITNEFLKNHPVYAGRSGDKTVGFWGIKRAEGRCELEYLYIAPEYLNCGYGRILWQHLTAWCREHTIPAFEFVTSPQAVGFYEKMGAAMIGETQSAIDGRNIPLLQYRLT